MSVTLYRAISAAEAADIRQVACLRPSVNSLEGKHFALSERDARRWGELLFGGAPFAIVALDIDNSALKNWVHWNRLDGIGPAYFADETQLGDCLNLSILDE